MVLVESSLKYLIDQSSYPGMVVLSFYIPSKYVETYEYERKWGI